MAKFTDDDLFKGIVLFGLNAATYKMALAKVLLKASKQGKTELSWSELSSSFLENYIN